MSDLGGSVLLIGVFVALAVVLRSLQWWLGRDRGLVRAQHQCARQEPRRSSGATAAMTGAATGPAPYGPNDVVSSSPANRVAER
ncbi:hypothetical protein [Amycolatopsis sp. NPDC051903]|uniref:hypothetical protein n=1 Tax=Amycolatopsis sp. NPDC051903 TaxID=3363936 RepID=UPI0037B6C6BD